MINRFKTKRKELILNNFGTVQLFSEGKGYYWFGVVKNISSDNGVELKINIEDKDDPLTNQTKLISDLMDNHERLMTILYDCIRSSFAKTGDKKTLEELKKMYFLAGVELKKDNKDWWIVFEPTFDVETIYNHFLRFTVRDMKVTWSNLG
jgi:hypothetical protein